MLTTTVIATIKLTAAQADWVDWALSGPISDYSVEILTHEHGCTIEEAERAVQNSNATKLDGKTLRLIADQGGEFLADLLNMLEDVAPDVTEGYGYEDALRNHSHSVAAMMTANRRKSAEAAARKIRNVMGMNG